MSTRHQRPAAFGAAAFALALALSPLAAPPALATPGPTHQVARPQLDASPAMIATAAAAAISKPPRDPAKSDVLVNKKYPLVPRKYVPRLTEVPGTGIRLQPQAAAAYKKLAAAARRDGVDIRLTSGYRSYAVQKGLLEKYTRAYGSTYAQRIAAKPGTSEHQTGLAIDVGNRNRACALRACFATTKVGRWMAKNAPAHGFILRYPKGMESVTGYAYEPWHFRYVGTAQAKAMAGSKSKTLEHFYGVAPAPGSTAAKPPAPKSGTEKNTRKTTANLNLRRGPSTGTGIIRTVPRDSTVRLTGKKSGSWLQATHRGSTGWMSARYLR